MAKSNRVLIIGGGVAGLSAGTYLQMNGYETCIFEQHSTPGGLCTSWRRDDYVFDACIHWLMGSGPWSRLHRVWTELGATQGRRFVEHDVYQQVDLPGGDRLVWYTDVGRLEAELLRLGPQDVTEVRRFADDVRLLARAELPLEPDLFERRDWLALAAAAPALAAMIVRRRGETVADLAARMRSPRLRDALALSVSPDTANVMPSWGLMMMSAYMHRRSAGYPIGGSQAFSRAIADRYEAFGGELRCGARVKRIVVEDGVARGVELADGTVERGDDVVSAADGHATLFDMLGGRYLTPRLREAYERWPRFPSLLFVSLGLGRDLKDLPQMLTFPPAPPLVFEGGARRVERLTARIFNFDPTLAPAGSTAVVFLIETTGFEYWSGLRSRDPARYAQEKQGVADAVIDAFDRHVGNVRGVVETVDVATPATWEHFTGNWQGSFEGWMPTATNVFRGLDRTLPGLQRFHMIGQWVSPGGGLPPAALDGRRLARTLCRRDGKRFVVPDRPAVAAHRPRAGGATEEAVHGSTRVGRPPTARPGDAPIAPR